MIIGDASPPIIAIITDNHHRASSASPTVVMIMMTTHQSYIIDDNHHYASSASPTIMMIMMTAHPLHLQSHHHRYLCITKDPHHSRGPSITVLMTVMMTANASAAPFPCASPFQEQGSADFKIGFSKSWLGLWDENTAWVILEKGPCPALPACVPKARPRFPSCNLSNFLAGKSQNSGVLNIEGSRGSNYSRKARPGPHLTGPFAPSKNMGFPW